MVGLEERKRVWWFFSKRVIKGWCCLVCERIAGVDEPERQWWGSWKPLRVPTAVAPRKKNSEVQIKFLSDRKRFQKT